MADMPSTPVPEGFTRVYHPGSDTYRSIPAARLNEFKASHGVQETQSKLESGLRGVGNGVSLGFGDELTGAVRAAPEALKAAIGGLTGSPDAHKHYQAAHDTYVRERDAAREKLAAAHDQNPWSYNGGELVGGLAPYAIPGAGAAKAAGTAAKLAGAVGGSAILGGLDGAGNSTADTHEGLANDAEMGAGIGAVTGGIGHGIGHLLGSAPKSLANAAARGFLEDAHVTPKMLEKTPTEALDFAHRAMRTPGVMPAAGQEASAEVIHSGATDARRAAGTRMSRLYSAFDTKHGPTVPVRELAKTVEAEAAPAMNAKPHVFRTHVRDAVRALHPEAFDAAEKGAASDVGTAHEGFKKAMAAGDLPAANRAQAAKAIAQQRVEEIAASPHTAFHPGHKLTLAETQEAINTLRGMGGAPGGGDTGDVLRAQKDIMKPAWRESAAALRGAVSKNEPPETLKAVNAVRSHYGDMRALEDAAEAGRHKAPPKKNYTKEMAGAGALLATGHPQLALGAAAKPVFDHVMAGHQGQKYMQMAGHAAKLAPAAPFVAPTAQSAATTALRPAPQHPGVPALANGGVVRPEAAPHVAAFTSTFGKFLGAVKPERQAAIDHKLSEISPRYRLLREKAEKEHRDAQDRVEDHPQKGR